MKPPTTNRIRGEILKLRRFIDGDSAGSSATRIAYAMETALRWTIEETEGWDLLVEAKTNARILETERTTHDER